VNNSSHVLFFGLSVQFIKIEGHLLEVFSFGNLSTCELTVWKSLEQIIDGSKVISSRIVPLVKIAIGWPVSAKEFEFLPLLPIFNLQESH